MVFQIDCMTSSTGLPIKPATDGRTKCLHHNAKIRFSIGNRKYFIYLCHKFERRAGMQRRISDILLRDDANNLAVQLFRYGVVGGIAFIADFGTLYLLTEYAGLPYLASASVGFCIGLATNWLLSIRWAFRGNVSKRNKGIEFIGWLITGLAGLGLNALIMWFFTEVLSIHYLTSKFISTAAVFCWNFFARRFLLSKL